MKIKYCLTMCLWMMTVLLQAQTPKELVILHTNDTHSRIEPLPETDFYNPGKGGVVNRKAIIDSIRAIHPNVILLDAGDFVQGTPYYNLFKGRVEVEAINRMGYDAVTLGNHEFDYGLDSLQMILKDLACPVVCCNYDFTGTPLEGMTQPYIILERDGLKVGIVGVGIDPDGLIQKDKYEGMKFLPVIETVNQYADLLRNKKKCDLVICLSHIGYEPDLKLAENSEYLDMIIGGHSHTILDAPTMHKNSSGKEVFVYQVGGQGSHIGEVKILFEK
ncbi:MAG: metallophosphoesterase [Tannerellaceae bacterium]|nr:metallophosphoesterase [Tannerellaceae bacterium]